MMVRRTWPLFACSALLLSACEPRDHSDVDGAPRRRLPPAGEHEPARPALGGAGAGGAGGEGQGGDGQPGTQVDLKACLDASQRLEDEFDLRPDRDCDAVLRFDKVWRLRGFTLRCQSAPHGIDADQARELAEAAGLPPQATVLEDKGVFVGHQPPSPDPGRLVAVSMVSNKVLLDASLGAKVTFLAPDTWVATPVGLDACPKDPQAPLFRGVALDTGDPLDGTTLAQARDAVTATALYQRMASARTWGGLSALTLQGAEHEDRVVLLWLRACWSCDGAESPDIK